MVSELDIKREYEELANTTKADVSEIVKSELFGRLIIEEATKGRKLKGIIAASEEAINKGDSDIVKVKIFPIISVSQVAEGASSEADAYKPLASTVTILRFNRVVPLTHESIYHASDNLVSRVLSALGKGYANIQDEYIANKLFVEAYTPAAKATLAVAGQLDDVYDKIKEVADVLRYDQGKNPDYLICGKEIAQKLINEYESGLNKKVIQVADDGTLKSVYGLKVIVTPYAPTVDATLSKVLAVVIDSSQALVEARGAPAKFVEKYEPEFDVHKEVFNSYWGVARVEGDLDGDTIAEAIGIGQIVNPAA